MLVLLLLWEAFVEQHRARGCPVALEEQLQPLKGVTDVAVVDDQREIHLRRSKQWSVEHCSRLQKAHWITVVEGEGILELCFTDTTGKGSSRGAEWNKFQLHSAFQ